MISRTPLSLAVAALFVAPVVMANHIITTENVNVKASLLSNDAPNTTVLSSARLQQDLIHNNLDLTRYRPGMGVAQTGRLKRGFAMRGVEGNRVTVQLDGMSLPDYEENTAYVRYGKVNSSRPNIDMEMVKTVTIDKGSDSVAAGSGALGGAVRFKTLTVEDLVEDGSTFGALGRVGYTSKNREWIETVTGGWRNDQVSALMLYSHHHGHELKPNSKATITHGAESQIADPAKTTEHSYLGKVRWHIAPEHSVGLNVNGSWEEDYTIENSRVKNAPINTNDLEHKDTQERHFFSVDYTYAPEHQALSSAKVVLDGTFFDTRGVTYEFNPTNSKLLKTSDRLFNTKAARLALELESSPIEWQGTHNLVSKLFVTKKHVKNETRDEDVGRPPMIYAMQRPVTTTEVGLALGDDVFWTVNAVPGHESVLGVHLGARIEHANVKPDDFNLPPDPAYTASKVDKITTKNYWNKAWSLGVDLEVDKTWKVGYNVASGYRIPTATDLFYSILKEHRGMKVGERIANPDLKPEHSLSHNLFVEGAGRLGGVSVNVFHAQYRDFMIERLIPDGYSETSQMINAERAHVTGVNASGHFNLDVISPVLEGARLMGAVGVTKGKTSEGLSLMAIQPWKLVGGLDYESPSKRYGVYTRVTHTGEKKAKDAVIGFDRRTGEPKTHPWLSEKSTVLDIFGWYRPAKNVTVRAGVYNVTNAKYHTWDTLRGVNWNIGRHPHAIFQSNVVDNDGVGLARFRAPGRNFSVNLEVKF